VPRKLPAKIAVFCLQANTTYPRDRVMTISNFNTDIQAVYCTNSQKICVKKNQKWRIKFNIRNGLVDDLWRSLFSIRAILKYFLNLWRYFFGRAEAVRQKNLPHYCNTHLHSSHEKLFTWKV